MNFGTFDETGISNFCIRQSWARVIICNVKIIKMLLLHLQLSEFDQGQGLNSRGGCIFLIGLARKQVIFGSKLVWK